MDAQGQIPWTPPTPKETVRVRLALEQKKFTENLRDEKRITRNTNQSQRGTHGH